MGSFYRTRSAPGSPAYFFQNCRFCCARGGLCADSTDARAQLRVREEGGFSQDEAGDDPVAQAQTFVSGTRGQKVGVHVAVAARERRSECTGLDLALLPRTLGSGADFLPLARIF